MPDPDRFEDEELTGDDFQGAHLESNPPTEDLDDEAIEQGDDFEGNRLEYESPPDRFYPEDLGDDDSAGQEARV